MSADAHYCVTITSFTTSAVIRDTFEGNMRRVSHAWYHHMQRRVHAAWFYFDGLAI